MYFPSERRVVLSLASLYAFRMLGLFMVLPVLALYAGDLDGASPSLIGLALGAYGFTQALLQIPFGMLSDKLGRKPVIVAGLIIFGLGSLVAASADSIWGIIFGRALQGGGAIASAVMALLADLTREESRTKAMASIGVSIGLSFSVAVILGPIINSWLGIEGIFLLTALLALVGIAIISLAVPSPPNVQRSHGDAGTLPRLLKSNLRDKELMRLNLGIFTLHAVLMAIFVTIPVQLVDFDIASERHWLYYLPLLVGTFIAMVPFIIVAEKKRKARSVFLAAIATLGLALALWALLGQSFAGFIVASILFFLAFNLLEATLPSLVSKQSGAGAKGTAMGIYSTSQFIGAFVGGAGGGLLYEFYGMAAVFWGAFVLVAIWWLAAAQMQPIRYLTGVVVPIHRYEGDNQSLVEQLSALDGVVEIAIFEDEQRAYLKVDGDNFDRGAVEQTLMMSQAS